MNRQLLAHENLPLAMILVSGFFLTGCMVGAEEPDQDPATVVVETRLPAGGAAPKRLEVTLTSNQGDVLSDTVTPRGSLRSIAPTALDPRGRGQVVTTEYRLAPNRKWNVAVRVLDANDSVCMAETGVIGALRAFDRRTAVLALEARYATLPATFALPAAHDGKALRITRLQLLVDGRVVRDTMAPGKGFAADAAVALTDDYVLPGERRVTYLAYGRIEGETEVRLLYRGETAVKAALGKQAEGQAVAMEWVGGTAADEYDTATFTVTIGKVGTAVIHAYIPGEIDI
jgi:hypothetical protein